MAAVVSAVALGETVAGIVLAQAIVYIVCTAPVVLIVGAAGAFVLFLGWPVAADVGMN